MLEDLDKINWSKLSHAYGSAEDVPDLLRALTSTDKGIRDNAYDTLNNYILHQGDIYEVTPYTVPFLIELLEQPLVEEKEHILYILDWIALQYILDLERLPLAEYQTVNQVEQEYYGVHEGLPLYQSLLNHPQLKVKEAATDLLATLNGSNKVS